MKRPGSDHYEPISWADAFALTAGHLRAIQPDEAIFYTSGRTSNEAAFLYQLLVRSYGTNNLPDCSNMCHESSGVALSATIGVGKGTVTLDDVHSAKLIVVVGQNPGTNHPRMLAALETAEAPRRQDHIGQPAARGRPHALQEPAARRRPPRQGHPALRPAPAHPRRRRPRPLPGHRRPAAAWGALDHDFIATHTTGFDAWRANPSVGALIAASHPTPPARPTPADLAADLTPATRQPQQRG